MMIKTSQSHKSLRISIRKSINSSTMGSMGCDRKGVNHNRGEPIPLPPLKETNLTGCLRGALAPLLKILSPSLVREGDKGGGLLSKYLRGMGSINNLYILYQ